MLLLRPPGLFTEPLREPPWEAKKSSGVARRDDKIQGRTYGQPDGVKKKKKKSVYTLDMNKRKEERAPFYCNLAILYCKMEHFLQYFVLLRMTLCVVTGSKLLHVFCTCLDKT